jgi:hypothetical protein
MTDGARLSGEARTAPESRRDPDPQFGAAMLGDCSLCRANGSLKPRLPR